MSFADENEYEDETILMPQLCSILSSSIKLFWTPMITSISTPINNESIQTIQSSPSSNSPPLVDEPQFHVNEHEHDNVHEHEKSMEHSLEDFVAHQAVVIDELLDDKALAQQELKNYREHIHQLEQLGELMEHDLFCCDSPCFSFLVLYIPTVGFDIPFILFYFILLFLFCVVVENTLVFLLMVVNTLQQQREESSQAHQQELDFVTRKASELEHQV